MELSNTVINIIIISAIILYFCIIGVTVNISKLLKEKRNTEINKNKTFKEDKSISNNQLGERIDYTVELMNLCDTLIDLEITSYMQTYLKLNQKYEFIHLDDDVKNIADKVFKAIKPEIIMSVDLVIDQDYISAHIVDSTIIKLLDFAQTFNMTLRSAT